MSKPEIAPYGSWRSPISSNAIITNFVVPDQVKVEGDSIWWVESRPQEDGRTVVVQRSGDGQITDLTPPGYNARSRVYEDAGANYGVVGNTVFFSNFADQRIYRHTAGTPPEPVTSTGGMRYADGIIDSSRGRMICVREDHAMPGNPVHTLVSINLNGDTGGEVLVFGNDFYASPRLSPDGSHLAWLTWNNPYMPHEVTELWVAEVGENGRLGKAAHVAGGAAESIVQIEWSPQGVLHFVSDRTGWWNLYRWHDGQIAPLCQMAAEFGRFDGIFGMSFFGFESEQRIICAYCQNGIWHLAGLDCATKKLEIIESLCTDIADVRVGSGYAVFCGGSPTQPKSIIRLELSTNRLEIVRAAQEVTIEAGYFSTPQAVAFATENGRTAYGFFYPPCNKDYIGPPGEQPPLLVKSHGGPIGATTTVLDYMIQYWTSRGIGLLDVNYGGSTGYGRAYRERLNSQWGIVDVDDCVNGARYLVTRGDADGNRLAITGGSAGGYTTLCALTFRDTFKAGASYYGISDLETLAKDAPKLSRHLLDNLIGPFEAGAHLLRERSPIHYTDRISCPMIILQGLEDSIVPPNQAERMVAALRAKKLPVAYLPFAGEGHGFRRAENIKRALEAEIYFYSRVFGFNFADAVEPVLIENL